MGGLYIHAGLSEWSDMKPVEQIKNIKVQCTSQVENLQNQDSENTPTVLAFSPSSDIGYAATDNATALHPYALD